MTARPIIPDRWSRCIHAEIALIVVIVMVLLTAGCGTTSDSQTQSYTVPHDKYVFVEHHIKTDGVTISGDCSPWGSIDFPLYQFDENNGLLTVSVSSNKTINDSLKMFYGDGENLAGVAGDGARTWASPVYSLPYTQDNVTLNTLSGDGTVTLHYNQKPIVLKLKERRVNTTSTIRVTEMPYHHNCTAEFIVTDSFYNAGFLDKGTIIARVLSS
jgi:hypothetical protein